MKSQKQIIEDYFNQCLAVDNELSYLYYQITKYDMNREEIASIIQYCSKLLNRIMHKYNED